MSQRCSPAPSMTSFSLDDQSSILNSTPIAQAEPTSPKETFHSPAPVTMADNNDVISSNDENNLDKNDSDNTLNTSKEHKEKDEQKEKIKAEKKAAKKLTKEMTICKIILEEMEVRGIQIFKAAQFLTIFIFRCMRIPGRSFCR